MSYTFLLANSTMFPQVEEVLVAHPYRVPFSHFLSWLFCPMPSIDTWATFQNIFVVQSGDCACLEGVGEELMDMGTTNLPKNCP